MYVCPVGFLWAVSVLPMLLCVLVTAVHGWQHFASPLIQVLQGYLSQLPNAHCSQSRDYSIGTADSRTLYAVGIHARPTILQIGNTIVA